MKLSVIIPMYNCCENVLKTLEKLYEQSKPFRGLLEVIVIDDGSTDEAAKEVEYMCYTLGFIHWRQDNAGGAAACNRGVRMATGDYLTFVDADDSITEDYVAINLGEIESGEYDFITNRWMYPDGQIGGRHEKPLVNWNVWGNVYRSELAKEVLFDEDINVAWDLDWLRRYYKDGMKVYNSDLVTNVYDTSNPDSITNRFNRGELSIRKSDKPSDS